MEYYGVDKPEIPTADITLRRGLFLRIAYWCLYAWIRRKESIVLFDAPVYPDSWRKPPTDLSALDTTLAALDDINKALKENEDGR